MVGCWRMPNMVTRPVNQCSSFMAHQAHDCFTILTGRSPHPSALASSPSTGAAMISSLGPLVGDTTKRMAWHIRLLLGLADDSYTLAKISWWLANLVRRQKA